MKTRGEAKTENVTESYRGFNGPGWELSVTGRSVWVRKMIKKLIPEVQRLANDLSKTSRNPKSPNESGSGVTEGEE